MQQKGPFGERCSLSPILSERWGLFQEIRLMANPDGILESPSQYAEVLGYFIVFLVLTASGCSLLPSRINDVRNQMEAGRLKLGLADRVSFHDVSSRDVDVSVYQEIVQEDPNTHDNLPISDSTEVLLVSGHTEGEQSEPPRSQLEALPPIEDEDEEPSLERLPEIPESTGAAESTKASESIPAPNPEHSTATPLQLRDVLESVVASYPLLEVAIQSRNIADGELLSAQGEFDLKLKGGGTSGPLGFYQTNRFGAGASQPLFSGGEIFGGYKIGRGNFQPWFGERETNDGGEVSAGVAIPLRQNRRIDARRAAIFRATYGRDAVEPEIQTQLLAFAWEASYAYWQWVAAGGNYQIARSLLEIAQERNDGLNKRVDLGDLARIELTDNQRLIVSRQATLIDARRKLQQSAIKLSLYLRAFDGQPIVPVEAQLPATFPEALSLDSTQLESDIQLAMSNRPELVWLELLRMQRGVDLAQARNLYLPEVDAVLFASQDMGGAASSSRDKSPFEMEASLQVNVPLQRRKAQGKIQALEGKLQQLSTKIGFTQDKIITDVQQVYTALLANYDRIAKALENLELARTMERAERRKFGLGDSNLLLVNLREQSTADAAKNVVQTQLDYFQARADYRAAMALDINSEIALLP